MAGSSNKVSFASTGEEGISLSMEVSASEDDELRVHITSTTNQQTLKLIVEVTCPYNPESMVATIHSGEVLHDIQYIDSMIKILGIQFHVELF